MDLWVPDCVIQYMLQDIETLSISIDIKHMEHFIFLLYHL
jgi:hypothetical protein